MADTNTNCIVGSCPLCTNPLFKEACFTAVSSFITRCPHCQEQLKVEVEIELRQKFKITPVEPDRIASTLFVLLLVANCLMPVLNAVS